MTKPTHGGIAPELFPGSVARAVLITESGLYKLVMRSDKPKAKEFQNWVTQVVLPSIRKDGGYVMGEEKLATGEMTEDQFILTAMRMMEDKVARYRAAICQ
ncbi:BRO-N domain-containing protein [Kaistia defluvii]|uniref:Prophage antirepressor-like protein n=1 Tax=Kaistia defluvii TaxID=410841 RepID=A0ABV2R0Y2_9HYPH